MPRLTRSRLREALRQWYWYGTINRRERVTHVLIAMGAAVCLFGAYLLFAYRASLSWFEPVSAVVVTRIEPRPFANIMTIMTSLVAAVCTAFSAILYGKRDQAHDPTHSLSYVTALVVALLAAIAATFGFAATTSIPGTTLAGPQLDLAFYLLTMSFIQLAISTGIVGITLIPIVNNRKDVFVDPLIKAISTVFWLPAGWIALLLFAIPGVVRSVLPMLVLVLAACMAQAWFPHGVYVQRGPKQYKAILWRFASFGFVMLATCTIMDGAFIVVSLAIPQPSHGFYAVTITLPSP